MSYKYNCGIKAEDGIMVEFDDIKDFYHFQKENQNNKHEIRGFVKSINVEILYCDEYDNGSYEWYVVNGKFLNQLEPLSWHPLEDYIQ